MAKRNHTRKRVVPMRSTAVKHERFLTVTLYPQANAKTPWIRLRGLWLLQAGFSPRMRVRVRVMKGCLVITSD